MLTESGDRSAMHYGTTTETDQQSDETKRSGERPKLSGSARSTATIEITESSPFAGKPGYRYARNLPDPIKRFLLACFWPLKALIEDLQDYSSELVGFVPCHGFRLWWYKHVCHVGIGADSSIHRQCRMYHPYKISIGSHSIINRGVLLDGRMGISIGDNVSISEGTAILTLEHDIDDPGFGLKGSPVSIGDYVFIGSFARILPGITIGQGAVVAAGAVVTRNVAPYSVVAGVPARYVRDRARNLTYQLVHRKRFG
jgi:acetyltransferase-like isoleucine patch superfamily enzyme